MCEFVFECVREPPRMQRQCIVGSTELSKNDDVAEECLTPPMVNQRVTHSLSLSHTPQPTHTHTHTTHTHTERDCVCQYLHTNYITVGKQTTRRKGGIHITYTCHILSGKTSLVIN